MNTRLTRQFLYLAILFFFFYSCQKQNAEKSKHSISDDVMQLSSYYGLKDVSVLDTSLVNKLSYQQINEILVSHKMYEVVVLTSDPSAMKILGKKIDVAMKRGDLLSNPILSAFIANSNMSPRLLVDVLTIAKAQGKTQINGEDAKQDFSFGIPDDGGSNVITYDDYFDWLNYSLTHAPNGKKSPGGGAGGGGVKLTPASITTEKEVNDLYSNEGKTITGVDPNFKKGDKSGLPVIKFPGVISGYQITFAWNTVVENNISTISVTNVSSSIYGATLWLSYDHKSSNTTINAGIISFIVIGVLNYNIVHDGIGTLLSVTARFTGTYNTLTGAYSITLSKG